MKIVRYSLNAREKSENHCENKLWKLKRNKNIEDNVQKQDKKLVKQCASKSNCYYKASSRPFRPIASQIVIKQINLDRKMNSR